MALPIGIPLLSLSVRGGLKGEDKTPARLVFPAGPMRRMHGRGAGQLRFQTLPGVEGAHGAFGKRYQDRLLAEAALQAPIALAVAKPHAIETIGVALG
jgi:hypothetical protein